MVRGQLSGRVDVVHTVNPPFAWLSVAAHLSSFPEPRGAPDGIQSSGEPSYCLRSRVRGPCLEPAHISSPAFFRETANFVLGRERARRLDKRIICSIADAYVSSWPEGPSQKLI